MGSKALLGLRDALVEIAHLEDASPTRPGKSPKKPDVTRAVNRASIVLLCSHFERYFYSVNEEIVEHVNAVLVDGTKLPQQLKLVHSKHSVEDMIPTNWENRSSKLEEFVVTDAWLWKAGMSGSLDAARLLAWMKAPNPESIIRYYRYWEISNIFDSVTRKKSTRDEMFFRIRTLVEKRNNIAHGDASEVATPSDIQNYSRSVLSFCLRADRTLSRKIASMLRCAAPW